MKMFRTVVLITLLAAVAVFGSGCAGLTDSVDPTKVPEMFYAQERTYEPFRLEGIAKLSLEAAEGETISLIMSSQLEPLSIYPRDPSTLSVAADAAVDIAKWAGAIFIGHTMAEGLVDRPTIVEQPAPIIVR